MKVETENPAAKKRKTDWVNGLKKMPGDTTLAKDTFLKTLPCYLLIFWVVCWAMKEIVYYQDFWEEILQYLSMFVEPSMPGTATSTAHPVDLVLEAFKTPEITSATISKLKNFLEEALKMHGKKLECAGLPATCSLNLGTFTFCPACFC